MADLVQVFAAGLVLWAPGLAWTWALMADLDLPAFFVVSVIVALTVQPGVMYIGNVFLGIPITPTNTVLLSLGLAALALAIRLRPELDRAWS